MLALSFQGIAYVNMAAKIVSAIKQLMCLKFTVGVTRDGINTENYG